VQIASFLRNSAVHGAALIHRERQAIAAAAGHGSHCRAPADLGGPRGLLEAPALGLVAPVAEGISDAVLNDAVGHVPASAWPGRWGTSVFAAHDVTWFARIDGLKRGDRIRYVTPCRTYTYRVTAHRVVHVGYPVYKTAIASMILDTCYPLSALYATSARYLVYATLARIAPTTVVPRPSLGTPGPSPVNRRGPAPAPLILLVPGALAAQGLGLDQNKVPLGGVRFAGSPSAAWRRAAAPLDAAAALAAYFGMVKSAEQNRRTWWAELAPSVPPYAAAGLWGSEITRYDKAVDVTLRVRGGQVLGATVTAVVVTGVATGDPRRQEPYRLTVTETVTETGRLLVSGFSMRSAAAQPTARDRRP